MLSGIPALHSSFIQQSTKFSAYIIVIGNKILNKEPYIIIIIANSVQSTWVKHNPHLVFRKTTDKTCSLWFFGTGLCRQNFALVLDTQTPKVQRVVCSEGCPQDCHVRVSSCFPSAAAATSARWRWQCPSDTGAAVSRWLHLPGTRRGCWMGQRASFGFCSVLQGASTPTEMHFNALCQPNAQLLCKWTKYFRHWKYLWGTPSINKQPTG